MSKVIVISGPPASGKSTKVKEIIGNESYSYEFLRFVNFKDTKANQERFKKLLRETRYFIIELVNCDDTKLAYYLDAFTNLNIEVIQSDGNYIPFADYLKTINSDFKFILTTQNKLTEEQKIIVKDCELIDLYKEGGENDWRIQRIVW